MSACTIREATVTDAQAIARLVAQLGYPTGSEEMTDRLRTLLARSDYITFVAESGDGVIVGLVGAYLGYALEFTGVYGRLTGVVVDGEWRGRGVGRLLIARIESWLRDQGASIVTLTSGRHRAEAHDFYRRLGYSETGIRFVKHLLAEVGD